LIPVPYFNKNINIKPKIRSLARDAPDAKLEGNPANLRPDTGYSAGYQASKPDKLGKIFNAQFERTNV
jgi:hypothetical protein